VDPSDSERTATVQTELALQAQDAGRSKRRRKWIMIAGTIANLVSPFAAGMLTEPLRSETLSLVAALAIPAGIGASIAYFGMTMTGHRRNALEWGFGIPGKCFWYGISPYLLVSFVFVFVLPMVIVWAAIGWGMTILGGCITSFTIDRWFYKEE
jgi:hypothetical protein